MQNRYSGQTNNILRRVLGFKTPNEMVEEYFINVAQSLTGWLLSHMFDNHRNVRVYVLTF